MSYFTGLRCSLCEEAFPAEALYVCDKCLGPLEATYDLDGIRQRVSRELIAARPGNLWRYREFLPIEGEPRTGFHSGWTPLVRAERLARELGLRELYLKDDSVNHPTLSYKDRVVSVAATRAVELGVRIFGCASTGNLGNSVAAHCRTPGPGVLRVHPARSRTRQDTGLRRVGSAGGRDRRHVRRRQPAVHAGGRPLRVGVRQHQPALLLRREGAKTYGFEIVEQLGWRFPQHVVCPVAGGTLLPRIGRGFRELVDIGLADGPLPRIHAAQAAGCAPVIHALENDLEHPEPVRPDTIAKSIAIGNPADGYHVLRTVRGSGGSGAAVSDPEILDAIALLARTEGIFTEPAGGTTLAAAIRLIRDEVIPRDESVVVCITGNGYKTADAMVDSVPAPRRIGRSLREFEAFLADRHEVHQRADGG